MRILLISTAFSGLTQRFYTELKDAGYVVSVELHLGDEARLLEGVELFKPDLILCPFLTRRIPKAIYQHYKCLIVHPGIKGDRGPSSLDWAIQQGLSEWGVTLLEAAEDMDSGAIWASKTFTLRTATKSSVFNREVTQAAVDCLWEALTYFDAPDFKPEPLDYARFDVKGQLRPMMKQTDRAIDWKKHKTDDILKRLHAADGSPGVLDEIHGKAFYLYNAHREEQLTGKPGDIIATANHAVCRATVDGAVWIGHLKPELPDGAWVKLPATMALKDLLFKPAKGLQGFLAKPIKAIEIDYSLPGKQLPCQEVWYELNGEVAYLYFPFHNGSMSTEQCRLLLSVYQHVATLNIKVIVLMGGEECWSNGIHLNHIEAADNPSDESWQNINAIDDLVYQIITTLDKLTIAAVAGNAGAGGAIMAIAPDLVFARDGVIFNPHYKNMGELYGSEYWTYLLPKRVGQVVATQLTEERLPISAKNAWRLGFVDKVLDRQNHIFAAQVKQLANTYLSDHDALAAVLARKATTRCFDEANKPLAAYRKFELTQMYANFYGNDDYHAARKRFVYKLGGATGTPENIAIHRKADELVSTILPGSLGHFVWQDIYQTDDELMDSEHKDLFVLADKLVASANQQELEHNIQIVYQHVKEHFSAEEALMKQLSYRGYSKHINEHNAMLKRLVEIDRQINQHKWAPQNIEIFMDKWGKHIIHSDMVFNTYLKEEMLEPMN
jgi:putative two-component system hydrogenase maturation factor HypX/HoxX